jgi:hypothetical protein
VLQEIAKVCLYVKRAGMPRWSVNGAFYHVRDSADLVDDHRTYRWNNNHSAYYARWLMRDVPELAGFFGTRKPRRLKWMATLM